MTPQRPFYATNARQLLEARQHGHTPDGPVVVTLVGGDFSDCAATALYVRQEMPADRMDWRMLVNLPVWLWASPQAPLDWLLATAKRIAAVRPRELLIRFEDGDRIHDVEVGSGHHRAAMLGEPPEHSFTWMPINLCGSALGYRLRTALRTQHPEWTFL